MIEKLNQPHEILAVANFVQEGGRSPMSFRVMRRIVDGYEVSLPKPLDATSAQYAEWLLKHPHPDVILKFTEADLNV